MERHLFIKTLVVLYNTYLEGIRTSYLSQKYSYDSESYRATEILTHLLTCLLWRIILKATGTFSLITKSLRTCYLREIVGCLFGFYGISPFVGYLKPHLNFSFSSYSVLSNISILILSVEYKNIFCLHTVKCQNNSIFNNSI